MFNKHGIPEEDLKKIKARDIKCVYCHKLMQEHSHVKGTPKDKATLEHLSNYPPFFWNELVIFDPSIVTICCGSCNSSRGPKELLDWFKEQYCLDRNINEKTVEEPVKEFIRAKRYLKIFTINQLSNQLRQFLENSGWRSAKTMPEIPHKYIVRDSLSENDKKIFDEFDMFIRKNGYTKKFFSKQYRYFNIKNYTYWVIENILNRAEIELKK